MRNSVGFNILKVSPVWLRGLARAFFLSYALCLSSPLRAWFPVADSGRLLYQEKQEVSFHTHFVFLPDKKMDFNMLVHFDELFLDRQDTNIRYVMGFGWSGLALGSFIKWIPFPDYKYQPGVGFSTGILYNPMNMKTHYVSLILRPLISKDINTIVGRFTPYIAFPGHIRIKNFTEFEFPLRAVFGFRGELFFIPWHKMDLNVEFGLGLTKGQTAYFSAGVITGLIL